MQCINVSHVQVHDTYLKQKVHALEEELARTRVLGNEVDTWEHQPRPETGRYKCVIFSKQSLNDLPYEPIFYLHPTCYRIL